MDIFSVMLCKRETKSVRCLQQQHHLLQGGKGEMQRVAQICACGEGGSISSAVWQPQPLCSEMSRLSLCMSLQESSHWEFLCVYTFFFFFYGRTDVPHASMELHMHLFVWSCAPYMHSSTLLLTLALGQHLRVDIFRSTSSSHNESTWLAVMCRAELCCLCSCIDSLLCFG